MGKTRGPYNAEFPVGSTVRIADRDLLEEFSRTWQYHHKLEPQPIQYHGRIAKVKTARAYHGGDEIYELEDIPGIWHEECLTAVSQTNDQVS